VFSLAVDAERAGWDGVFFWDHMTWLPERRLHVHDPWVLLGAVAVRTERVQLGTMAGSTNSGPRSVAGRATDEVRQTLEGAAS
jgi:alkanesulfonate monooxygenase SsuD/methylene tetrahydromethanopterin reductase-like flavin-dependent oxidoreductase (luciferase family)